MDDANRRRRFMSWFRRTYGDGPDARAKFIVDSGRRGYEPLTKGRVSQYFDPDLAFGERAARQLALRVGLDEDYFLRDLSDRAFNAGLMLDEIEDEATKAKIYAFWVTVHQLAKSGQPFDIIIGDSVASPAVKLPTRARRSDL